MRRVLLVLMMSIYTFIPIVYAQDTISAKNNNDTILTKPYFNDTTKSIVVTGKQIITTITVKHDSVYTRCYLPVLDNDEFLPLSEFTYAGYQRYTADGEPPRLTTKIKPVTASIIGGVVLASGIILHYNQMNAWWKNQRGGFHFAEDWVSALQVDKCGHAFGGYLMAYGMDEAMRTSGVEYHTSAILGSAFAVAYQSYVEIEDGFAHEWGFSPSDLYFDAMGPAFYLAQHYVPALQNITPKWQYVPTEWVQKSSLKRPKTFIDDYNSSTFWYSLNVYNILPDNAKKYWVPWLNLAFGYGADATDEQSSLDGPPDQLSKRRYVVSLDYNLVRLLPEGGNFWNWFRQTLNYIKFPSPAVEFSSAGTRFHLLYPFKIDLGGLKL